jgi:hypothetical protein
MLKFNMNNLVPPFSNEDAERFRKIATTTEQQFIAMGRALSAWGATLRSKPQSIMGIDLAAEMTSDKTVRAIISKCPNSDAEFKVIEL